MSCMRPHAPTGEIALGLNRDSRFATATSSRGSTPCLFAASTLVAALSYAGVHCTMPPPPSNIPNNLVFSGGTVVSGSTQTPHANYAVAVADGRVVAVGPNAEILRTFPNARVIDVTGTTVLP